MPFATWWRRDPLPELTPLPAFSARPSLDTSLLTRLTALSEQEVQHRIQGGHRPYVAFLEATPVAYGWIATRKGGIAELNFSFPIAENNCYLWDFMTLPEWRGRGVYPHLLQAIIRQEDTFERFWIGYQPGNDVSGHAMTKAGFRIVSDLVMDGRRIVGMGIFDSSEYAQASGAFFHLPIVR